LVLALPVEGKGFASTVMLPLYILTLGLSSGLVGVFFRHLLAEAGFVPDFETGMVLAASVGALYAASQLAYVGGLQLLKPSKSTGPLLPESLSHAAALAFLPLLLGVDIPWPHPALAKIEPLIYLAAFGAPHLVFKLITLFSATQALQGRRAVALLWLVPCVLCLSGAQAGYFQWRAALHHHQNTTLPEARGAQSGGAWALAHSLSEGRVYTLDLSALRDQDLVLRWAHDGEDEAFSSAHIAVDFPGTEAAPLSQEIPLPESGWHDWRLPAAQRPKDASSCRVSWSTKAESSWMARTGIRPLRPSAHTLNLAGPFGHLPADANPAASIVFIVVEGLGAEHISSRGYRRATTPAIDAFAEQSISFVEAYTPAPDAAAACMTLLSGLHPLRHGYLGAAAGPLPEDVWLLPESLARAGYATAAFTEGAGPDGDDLVFGSGFERGFEHFDPTYPTKTRGPDDSGRPRPPVPAGSRVTLGKARGWIEAHQDEKFMIFVRLRELRKPTRLRRYGEGFLGRGRTPTPLDVYDTALADVDRQLGAFFEELDLMDGLDNLAMVLTSPYGFDFSEPGRGAWRRSGLPKRRLTESSLRVPLYLSMPGRRRGEQNGFASLENVAPTLLEVARLPQPMGGSRSGVLMDSARDDVISVQGNPLMLSLRIRNWRYTWESGRHPFTHAESGAEAVLGMLDVDRYRSDQAPINNLKRFPESAENFRNRLAAFLHGIEARGAAKEE
jgi:hypothetical protein